MEIKVIGLEYRLGNRLGETSHKRRLSVYNRDYTFSESIPIYTYNMNGYTLVKITPKIFFNP